MGPVGVSFPAWQIVLHTHGAYGEPQPHAHHRLTLCVHVTFPVERKDNYCWKAWRLLWRLLDRHMMYTYCLRHMDLQHMDLQHAG